MKTTLSLPFPPSANSYWRSAPGKGLVPSAEATAYKRAIAQLARGVAPFVGPVAVLVRAFRPRTIGDLDNVLKVLFDALSGVAWLDDGQVVHLVADREDDAANPRVEVEATGERFATAAEVAAHAKAKRDANQKRRKTLAMNRAAKRLRATPNVYRGAR